MAMNARLSGLVLALIVAAGPASAQSAEQWAAIGNNIYNINTGNVGIGTTNPDRTVHIKTSSGEAALALDGPGTSDSAIYFYRAGSPKFVLYNEGTTDIVHLRSNLGAELFFDLFGRLSLGNTQAAPTTDFYVRKNNKTPASDTYNQMIVTPGQGADFGGSLAFGGGTDSVGNDPSIKAFGGIAGRKENGTADNTAGYLALSVRPNGGTALTEAVRISSTGNVGIGTTTPGTRLDVLPATDSYFDGIRVQRVATPSQYGVVNYSHGALNLVAVDDTSLQSGILFFQGTTSGSTHEVGRFDHFGQFGIGRIPNETLSIQDIPGRDILGLRDSAGGYVGYIDANGNVGIGTTTVANARLTVMGGNVGIGTTAPAAKLHVAGNVQVDGNISARYQDVAEWVRTRDVLAPGTVVVIGATEPGFVEASQQPYDTAVAGVVSPQPGIVLGEPGADKVLVAQSGRVRVKVDASYGAVRAGDLLVTSPTPGLAMRSEPMTVGGRSFHQPGTLLGKALEPLASGQGDILVLLTLQ